MISGIRVGNLTIDCADAEKLCDFYVALLGGTKCVAYGLPAVRDDTGLIYLFEQEEDYVPPIWPEQVGQQQKQIHIDYQVADLPAAVREAEQLGAVVTPDQFGGDDFVTLLDPAGHPFCLCADTNPI